MSTPAPPPPPPPHGVYVPAVVFLDEHEELDAPAIRAHVLRLAQGGVRGILVQGSNGEAQLLSHDERTAAIRLTRDTLDTNGFQDTIILAGTGAQSTKETIKLCRDAAEAGAAYALVLTPSTWPTQMKQANIVRFFHTVADASPIPIMIYNFPTVTAGIDLDSDTLLAIAQHPRVVGTKLSCGNVGKLHRVASALPASEFAAFPGKSDVFLQGLVSGSAGVIGALPNVAPKAHAHLLKLYGEGKLAEATKLQALLGQSDWELGKLGSIAGIKAIVSKHFGYGAPHVKGPLAPLLDEEKVANAKLEELIALEKSL
ncbi:dihydrodipicolinate synthetase [Phanerochaete sordida]|uniref:Dihydrodipicolinate synthetase n=1 Tax=Phanerochaete sordida TaxID=48140 RepID=A0A9P3GVY1_9APHY|nr:dihydrodipicolinate synthetase [Phanerochaete sordida]